MCLVDALNAHAILQKIICNEVQHCMSCLSSGLLSEALVDCVCLTTLQLYVSIK